MTHPLSKVVRAVQKKLHEDPKLDYIQYTWVLREVEREYDSAKAQAKAEWLPPSEFKARLQAILVERLRPRARLDPDADQSAG